MKLKIVFYITEPTEKKPKSKLELEAEDLISKDGFDTQEFEATELFLHIKNSEEYQISIEILELISKKLCLLIRNLQQDAIIALYEIFKEAVNEEHYQPKKNQSNIKIILEKNQAAAFNRLINAARAVKYAQAMFHQKNINLGHGILYAGMREIYQGDQSLFSDDRKSSTEVAKMGGRAKSEIYKPVKKKICALIKEIEPTEGWPSKNEAFKSVLPKVKEYLHENNIRYPAPHNIESTLRNWINEDEMISMAIRLTYNTKSY